MYAGSQEYSVDVGSEDRGTDGRGWPEMANVPLEGQLAELFKQTAACIILHAFLFPIEASDDNSCGNVASDTS